MDSLHDAVRRSSYPGRGIILGRTEDGESALIAYFIMGRSENSRNRVFVPVGDDLRTQAFDERLVSDPSLIIYSPVRTYGDHTIVTNGNQTDTVYNYFRRKEGGGVPARALFPMALESREFEPDPPHYTPRISGLLTLRDGAMRYSLHIIKSDDGNPCQNLRFTYAYDAPPAGEGHFLHTYQGDGNPLPSFAGEPEKVAVRGGVDDIADALWRGLDDQNKISLFVRLIHIASRESVTRIVNKHQ